MLMLRRFKIWRRIAVKPMKSASTRWHRTGIDKQNLTLWYRKAGRAWCGGARETHWATCHDRVTPSKTKEFLKSPRFLVLNGSLNLTLSYIYIINRWELKSFILKSSWKCCTQKIEIKTYLFLLFARKNSLIYFLTAHRFQLFNSLWL